MLRPFPLVALLLVSTGCGTRGVRFEGDREPAIARAGDIRELESLPEGYTRLGEVRASCELDQKEQPEDALLSDVVCSQSRILAAIRERAAEVGGELLIGRQCRSHGDDTLTITCSAEVARPSDDERSLRPLAGGTLARDCSEPRAAEAWNIRVHFAKNPAIPPRKPKHPDAVREVPLPPLSHVRIGDLVTRCSSGCSEVGARRGLLAAASRYGATDVVDLHCVQKHEGWMCTGVAMAYEVDPAWDPSAH
jgi:hypothetical protein